MTSYINTLIISMLVSQAAVLILPDSKGSKQYVKLICALIILLNIVSPVKHLGEIKSRVTEFFSSFSESGQAAGEGGMYSADGYAIMKYIIGEYKLSGEGMSVTFITDEDGEKVREIQIIIEKCPQFVKEKISSQLGKELEVDVYVFGGEDES